MRTVGRYVLHDEIGSGGMASVHLGSLTGPIGFSRIVAIKRLRPEFLRDADVIARLIDEARLTSRIQHPNVVPTLDVVAHEDELFLVMEYVHGAPLSMLLSAAKARAERVPVAIAAMIIVNVLHGLHAAHELKGVDGRPVELVHRDVSPQNIFVGADGIARILDFGVAKAFGQVHVTRHGHIAGKLAYMAPEQLTGFATRKSDVFAAGVVLWETLTGRRLFRAKNDTSTLESVLHAEIAPPSAMAKTIDERRELEPLDGVVLRALDREVSRRFDTAQAAAAAIEEVVGARSVSDVAAWVERLVPERLRENSQRVAAIEQAVISLPISAPPPAPTIPVPSVLAPAEAKGEIRRTRTSRRRLVAILLGAAVAGVFATAIAVKPARVLERGEPAAVHSAPRVDSEAPIAAPVVSSAPSVAPVLEDAAAVPAPQVKAIRRSNAPPPSAQKAGQVKEECDPPFYINSAGRKVFKHGCIR